MLAEASRNPPVHAAVTANDKVLRAAFLAALRRGQNDGRIPSAARKLMAKAAKTVLNRLSAG